MLDSVVTVRPKPDRRNGRRRPLPACNRCSETAVAVILRADRVIYVECPSCHHLLGVPIGVEQPQPAL